MSAHIPAVEEGWHYRFLVLMVRLGCLFCGQQAAILGSCHKKAIRVTSKTMCLRHDFMRINNFTRCTYGAQRCGKSQPSARAPG